MKFVRLVVFCTLMMSSISIIAQPCVGAQGEVTWSYWGNLNDDQLGEMFVDPDYPNNPDATRKLGYIQSPYNYNEQYGSIIRGFIRIPTTQSVIFNITGDDDAKFYLSSTILPANLNVIAFVDGYTNVEQHDKYPEQTSEPILLQGNQYYYFEVHQIEGGGGDHVTVWWKTTFTGNAEWVPVGGDYIFDLGCLPEPHQAQGSFCSDANPLTADDMQDGVGNCLGQTATSNTCIGKRGSIKMYRYRDITGNNLEQLELAPNFPLSPSTSYNLNELALGFQRREDNFGTFVQGYLTVPVTGQYQFNITGSNQSRFSLSLNDLPAYVNAMKIFTQNSTSTVEFDNVSTQTSPLIILEAGKYYYFEVKHKEGGGDEHFSVFWKTPWRSDSWHRISAFYCYEYNCSLACVPPNTVCDDGNIYTNNDRFNANCDCEGTPCSGPECDDLEASYVAFESCDVTDQLDAEKKYSWESCTTSAAPYSLRGNTHWIQYDFGTMYKLFETQVWNYNVAGETSKGFTTVGIDYSMDGVNWTSLGSYNWNLAPGSVDYAGFDGPNFGGVEARYILISSLTNNTSCKGLSKILFTSRECLPAGTPCDDGNAETFDDRYDANCDCLGRTGDANDCALDMVMLGDSILSGEKYTAIGIIESSSRVVQNTNVEFMASESITLHPGFVGELGANLQVQIGDCIPESIKVGDEQLKKIAKRISDEEPLEVSIIKKYQYNYYKIKYKLDKPGYAKLTLVNPENNTTIELVNHEIANTGIYNKFVPVSKIIGEWQAILKIENANFKKPLKAIQ